MKKNPDPLRYGSSKRLVEWNGVHEGAETFQRDIGEKRARSEYRLRCDISTERFKAELSSREQSRTTAAKRVKHRSAGRSSPLL
jgi:hypothetical protein